MRIHFFLFILIGCFVSFTCSGKTISKDSPLKTFEKNSYLFFHLTNSPTIDLSDKNRDIIIYCDNDINISVTSHTPCPIVTFDIEFPVFYLYLDEHDVPLYWAEGNLKYTTDILEDSMALSSNTKIIENIKAQLFKNLKNIIDIEIINVSPNVMKNNKQYLEENVESLVHEFYYSEEHIITLINDNFFLLLRREVYLHPLAGGAANGWYWLFDTKTRKPLNNKDMFSANGFHSMLVAMTERLPNWLFEGKNLTYQQKYDFVMHMRDKHFLLDEHEIEDIKYEKDGLIVISESGHNDMGFGYYLNHELCDDNFESPLCPFFICNACSYEVDFTTEECLSFFKTNSPVYKWYSQKDRMCYYRDLDDYGDYGDFKLFKVSK